MIKHMTTLTMCPMTHVPHFQGAPSLFSVLTMIPICPHYDHVPHCPCAPSPICTPSLSLILHNLIPLCPCVPLPIVSCSHIKKDVIVCQKDVKACQKDVKLSKRCQMSKSQTHGLWKRFIKKIN